MVSAMKKVVSWKKLKVTLAQAVREGFLEKVTFELWPDYKEAVISRSQGPRESMLGRENSKEKAFISCPVIKYEY